MSDTSGGFNILSGFGTKGVNNVGTGLTDIGGAVADLFAAQGDKSEATNYTAAAGLADQNAQYTMLSTGIKNMQADREIYQTIGKESADVAASGFSSGGSAGDLLRSSASQGALTHATLSEQGLIQEQGYEEQASSYRNMAEAANSAATGSTIGGILKGVAGVAALALAPVTGGASLAVGAAATSAMGDPTGIGGLY
jgi:hypothetical protein